MSNRLDNKAVIVTGAAQGLGRMYAHTAASLGASVVINDRNEAGAQEVAAEIIAAGGQAIAAGGSVSSWEDSSNVVQTCIREFGRLDGYVANAAIMHMGSPWEESEEALRSIVEVNVLGVQIGARHALKAMVESGAGGSLVTVVSGAQHGILGMSAYGATKGAVTAMTLNWALEAAPYGIRVNAVSPWAMTPMTAEHLSTSQLADASAFPTPDSIAPVVAALLSDATAGLTGKLIRFDGTTLSAYEHEQVPLGSQPAWSLEEISAALMSQLSPVA